MSDLFLIKKHLTPKMKNAVRVKTNNESEKRQVINTVRSLKYSYYMIPITKVNFINIALMLNEVKSITK